MLSTLFKLIVRERVSLLFLGGALLLTLLIVRVVAIPQWQAAGDLARQTRTLRTMISDGDSGSVFMRKLRSDHSQLYARLDTLSAGLGSVSDLSSVLSMLIDRAARADVKFSRIQPLATRIQDGVVLYPILLETTTSYVGFGSLVENYEAMPDVVRIERISVQSLRYPGMSVTLLVTCFLEERAP